MTVNHYETDTQVIMTKTQIYLLKVIMTKSHNWQSWNNDKSKLLGKTAKQKLKSSIKSQFNFLSFLTANYVFF